MRDKIDSVLLGSGPGDTSTRSSTRPFEPCASPSKQGCSVVFFSVLLLLSCTRSSSEQGTGPGPPDGVPVEFDCGMRRLGVEFARMLARRRKSSFSPEWAGTWWERPCKSRDSARVQLRPLHLGKGVPLLPKQQHRRRRRRRQGGEESVKIILGILLKLAKLITKGSDQVTAAPFGMLCTPILRMGMTQTTGQQADQ